MISILLYGRNDDRGYGMTKRVAIGLNTLALQVDGGTGEVLFVDYNTPDHLPTLPELIWDSLTATARRRLRVLRVRPRHHARFETALPVLEPVARNVALRRSNGANRWVLSTNTDAMVARLGEQRLVDAAEALLDGVYGLPRFELPERCWEGFDRRDPEGCLALAAAWSEECRLREAVEGVPDVLFDNPGDFQLMPRADLMAIGGFEEEMLDGWHVDHNIARRMAFRLGPPRSLADRFALYHLGHARSVTATHGADRGENDVGRFVHDLSGPQALHQPGGWGLPEEEIEEIRLDVAPGEAVRAACRAAMAPLGGRTPTARYAPESFDRFACDAGAVAAHLLDLLSPLPRDAVLAFAGARRDVFETLMRGLAALGFENRLLVPESVAERLDAARHGTAQVGPDAAVFGRADALIFAFGLIRDETGAAQGDSQETLEETAALDAVAAALHEAARIERRRRVAGGTERLFVVANAVHSRFEREVDSLIAASASPFSTRLRHGYLRGRGGDAPRAVHAEARRWLPLLSAGRPLSRRERLEIAVRGDEIAALIDEAAALEGAGDEVAAMRRALAECRAPHAALRTPLAPVGAPGLSTAARADSWSDPAWRAEARRMGAGAARTGWIWERAQLLHGLGRLLPDDAGRILVVCEHPEPMVDALRGRFGRDVATLDVRTLFGEAPVLPDSSGLTDILPGGCRAVVAPHAGLFRHGLPRSGAAMAALRPLLRPGGVFAVAAEIALNGRERAMRPCLEAAEPEGLPSALAAHLGLAPVGAGATAPRPEDAALVATPEEMRQEISALGLATGEDVLWPATWFFAAQEGAATPDADALSAALSDLQLGDLLGSLSLGAGAERDEAGRIRAPRDGAKAGHAVYGPYLRLAPGAYRAALVVEHARRAGARGGRMAAEAALGGEAVARRKLGPGRSTRREEIALDFRVPPDAPPLEVRLWTDGGCAFVVSAASLTRSRATAPTVASERRASLIGR